MTPAKSFLLRILVLVPMCGIAFGAGWFTSVHSFSDTKRTPIQYNLRGGIHIPRGHALALVSREVTNQGFIPGDRVDVLVKFEENWSPLVMDAVVAREDWQTVALIVRSEEAALFHQARAIDMNFRYRMTLAPE